jgi:hypothetical protein
MTTSSTSETGSGLRDVLNAALTEPAPTLSFAPGNFMTQAQGLDVVKDAITDIVVIRTDARLGDCKWLHMVELALTMIRDSLDGDGRFEACKERERNWLIVLANNSAYMSSVDGVVPPGLLSSLRPTKGRVHELLRERVFVNDDFQAKWLRLALYTIEAVETLTNETADHGGCTDEVFLAAMKAQHDLAAFVAHGN